MTVPAIAPQVPTDETSNASRQAHERNSVDGPARGRLSQQAINAEYHEGLIRSEES
jgi:hypothetical protein